MNHLKSLVWEDFGALAAWMAEEIGGSYYMDKKSYKKQPPSAPFRFLYRVPVYLYSEERTLFALFIRRIFWAYFKKGQTKGFDSQEMLRRLAWQLGLKGYENSRDLRTLCWQFADKFPGFINMVKGGGKI